MSEPQKTVFISYRRDVGAFIARAIFLELREHGYDVFMDVESIDAGQFEQIIFNQIEGASAFSDYPRTGDGGALCPDE